jgi:hypothetical protein
MLFARNKSSDENRDAVKSQNISPNLCGPLPRRQDRNHPYWSRSVSWNGWVSSRFARVDQITIDDPNQLHDSLA